MKAFGEKSWSLRNRWNLAYEVSENAYMLLYWEKNESSIDKVDDNCISEELRKDIQNDMSIEQQ